MRSRISGRARHALTVLALTATAAGGAAALSGPAFAGGGIDLQRYGCDIQSPGSWVVLRNNDVYGWKCFNGLYDLPINVTSACRAKYGSSSSAYYTNYSNPYSWLCR
jgi:hypothetical protein